MFLTVGWVTPLAVAENQTSLEENPPTNEEFLRGALRSLLEKTFTKFPKNTSDFITIKAEEDRPENWLVEDELVNFLLSLNCQVSLSPVDSNQNLAESKWLYYRIIDLKLDYPKTQRKGFWGEKSVIRKAGLNLSFREEDKTTGKVLWSQRGQKELSDTVKNNLIKSLNNYSYPFLCPSPSRDPLSRFVEPAVVTTVVGGLVYLFFANR